MHIKWLNDALAVLELHDNGALSSLMVCMECGHGIVIFGDMEGANEVRWCLFISGWIISILGVFFIVRYVHSKQTEVISHIASTVRHGHCL